eukprot:5430084-Prymnesium_polylepis.1
MTPTRCVCPCTRARRRARHASSAIYSVAGGDVASRRHRALGRRASGAAAVEGDADPKARASAACCPSARARPAVAVCWQSRRRSPSPTAAKSWSGWHRPYGSRCAMRASPRAAASDAGERHAHQALIPWSACGTAAALARVAGRKHPTRLARLVPCGRPQGYLVRERCCAPGGGGILS